MLSGLLMVWLLSMLIGARAVRWFEEQRNNDASGRDRTRSIIIDISVDDATYPPRGLLDEVVVSHADSILNPRAQARRRSARGPPGRPCSRADEGQQRTDRRETC
jgi:hypothetical protein